MADDGLHGNDRNEELPNKSTVTAANLKQLGAKRLADLLLEVSQDNPQLKRRLRYELAGESGVETIAADIAKRLRSLQQARSFIDWQKRRTFVKDIDLLRRMILDKVAEPHPDLALDLLWRFMALAGPTIERVDDSNGDVGEVFRTACKDLGNVAAKASPDPVRLADQVFRAVTSNDYGQYDDLIAAIYPALRATGARRLREQLTAAWKHPTREDPDGFKARSLKCSLQDVADQEGDVDAFIALETESGRKMPDVAAAIGQRLLAAGRPSEALEVLKRAAPKQSVPSREDLEDSLALGFEDLDASDWSNVWVDALVANNRLAEAQKFRWSRFERWLDTKSLRSYLKALPDSDDMEAEQRAMEYALRFPHFSTALRFLIEWPDQHTAAGLVLQRRGEIDGNLYFLLDPAAKALEARYPQAATLLYRAMIEDTLQGVKSTRYGHAARHLLECQSLTRLIKDNDALESHDVFVARIQASHSRKTGFWSRVVAG